MLASAFAFFENNRSNNNKTQVQRMGSIPILYINVNITIDRMLKFDANVDIDPKCEWTSKSIHKKWVCSTSVSV